MYLKPPGESDGCVDPSKQTQNLKGQCAHDPSYSFARYDTMCGIKYTQGYPEADGKGNICPPEAGQWSDPQWTMLQNNFK